MSDDVCFVERSVYDALSLRRPWVASKPLRAITRPDTAPQKPAKHHSALSWADHAWFLTALEARATLSATDARRLAELSATVDTEQAAYRRDRAAAVDQNKLRRIDSRVRDWVLHWLTLRRARPLAFTCFSPLVVLPLDQGRDATVTPPLVSVRELKRTFALNTMRTLPAGTRLPQPPPLQPSDVLSEDVVASALAERENGALLMLCGSAWAALTGARPGGSMIPVTVNQQGHVIFDKPLLAATLSCRAANELYFSAALRHALCAHTEGVSREYRLWRWGAMKLLTRVRLAGSAVADGRAAFMRVKLEYAPEAGREEATLAERGRAWAAVVLRPGFAALTARVGVAQAVFLTVEREDGVHSAPVFDAAAALQRAHALLSLVASQPVGRYLLCIEDVKAVLMRQDESGGPGVLRVDNIMADGGKLVLNGVEEVVPLRWQATQGTPQIPYTYPPHGTPDVAPSRRAKQQAERVGL